MHGDKEPRIQYLDDDTYSVQKLVLRRIPSLAVGLVLGVAISFATSRFEEVLLRNIEAVFFVPFVIYMADAVGTQTQSIYTRDLRTGRAKFKTYLVKETALGIVLGFFFGLASWGIVSLWFGSSALAMTVGLAMFAVIASAPLVALIVTEILHLEHHDPAVGAGPIATVIQDTISVTIFGLIATAALLG